MSSQIVAYSGFSSSNYIREAYSADLDFGIGEWSISAWANVPTTYTAFPLGSELISDPTLTTATGWSPGTSFSGGVYTTGGVTENYGVGLATVGNVYKYTYTVTGTTSTGGLAIYIAGVQVGTSSPIPPGTYSGYVVATGTQLCQLYNPWGWTGSIDTISIQEVATSTIVSRAYSSGPSISLGLMGNGKFVATAYDGTTTCTVPTTASYNTGTWYKVRASYKTDGSLSISVNGQQVATTGALGPLLTLNNSNAVLTIGNNYALTAQFPGSLSLIKISATVPSTEQMVYAYEQEKQMFRDGSQITLPDSTTVLGLSYDDDTDRVIVVSQSNKSAWTGLVRVSSDAVSFGGLNTGVAAESGVNLISRSTVDAGVDVTIPATNIKTMLERDRAADKNQQIAIFTYDPIVVFSNATLTNGSTLMTCLAANVTGTPYVGMTVSGTGLAAGTTIVGISNGTPTNSYYLSNPFTGTTGSSFTVSQLSFALPVGYTPTAIYKNGAEIRESTSTTKDWSRSFDGFREVILLTTAPALNDWIQIHATKDN